VASNSAAVEVRRLRPSELAAQAAGQVAQQASAQAAQQVAQQASAQVAQQVAQQSLALVAQQVSPAMVLTSSASRAAQSVVSVGLVS
jgi:uncharacterized protein YaaW (UPF0174 family)